MGIVNVTPDSFSDGGAFLDVDAAVQHGRELVRQGADLLDIGGESTRPGAHPVCAEEEIRRVIPVIRRLRKLCPDVLISIDTSKARVASESVEAGADIVNDVTAGTGDPDMLDRVAATPAGYILMHMRGIPRSMQNSPDYSDVTAEVLAYLNERVEAAVAAGINRERLAVDPGIGFGKTLEHNLTLLAGLPAFASLNRPLLLGVSRKRWLGELTDRPVDQRLAGSLAGAAACIERGAHILRVHDVAQTRDVIQVIDTIKRTETAEG